MDTNESSILQSKDTMVPYNEATPLKVLFIKRMKSLHIEFNHPIFSLGIWWLWWILIYPLWQPFPSIIFHRTSRLFIIKLYREELRVPWILFIDPHLNHHWYTLWPPCLSRPKAKLFNSISNKFIKYNVYRFQAW